MNKNKVAPALGPAVIRAIGRKLRAMYADIIAEGCRNDLSPYCTGWTSRATTARHSFIRSRRQTAADVRMDREFRRRPDVTRPQWRQQETNPKPVAATCAPQESPRCRGQKVRLARLLNAASSKRTGSRPPRLAAAITLAARLREPR